MKNSTQKLAVVPSQSEQPTKRQQSDVVMVRGQIVKVSDDLDTYTVNIEGSEFSATLGALLPTLTIGDIVLLADDSLSGRHVITAIILPAANQPLSERPIALRSNQSITLTTGTTTLKLTADGLARLVGHAIENQARDLVQIDAAEIRLN